MTLTGEQQLNNLELEKLAELDTSGNLKELASLNALYQSIGDDAENSA